MICKIVRLTHIQIPLILSSLSPWVYVASPPLSSSLLEPLREGAGGGRQGTQRNYGLEIETRGGWWGRGGVGEAAQKLITKAEAAAVASSASLLAEGSVNSVGEFRKAI